MVPSTAPGPHAPDAVPLSFELFRDRNGHWCARRADGRVCGTFFERDAAIRFARRESEGASLVVAADPDGDKTHGDGSAPHFSKH